MPATVTFSKKPYKPFRFLDLPTELRIKVYQHVFQGFVQHKQPYRRDWPPRWLFLNKQFHYEATQVYYQAVKFYVRGPGGLGFWLRNIPARYRNEIRYAWTTLKQVDGKQEEVNKAVQWFKEEMAKTGVEVKPGVLWVPSWDGDDVVWCNELGERERWVKGGEGAPGWI